MQVPEPLELIKRIKAAMPEAHDEWERAVPRRAGVGTQALSRRVWEMGFDYEGVYPTAHGLGADAEDVASKRLSARGASFSGSSAGHSTLGEFQYDVAWVEFRGEYEEDLAPPFRRLILALESEFGDERAVLFDFHKLLCARPSLRVMVWDADKVPDGLETLDRRLQLAAGADDGYWLLSAWSTKGFTHTKYRGIARLHCANGQ